ncbi:TPA: ATP-binding protein [Candidatus Woesearchaeota archaeon]|nr:ATP-binding protein [Candidatus Woesearchaeota archaeon]
MAMKQEALYYVLYEQQKEFQENREYVERELTKKAISFIRLKLPIVVTGIRRAGKSTLLKIIKNELQLKEKDYLYINFNDERLIDFSVEDFQKILDFANEQGFKENCYLFIDEIQEVNKWEKWVDRIKEKHPILITGSNSKLLSKEISTILTGRSINTNLYPFSFREFLDAKKIDIANFRLDIKLQAILRKEFSLFLDSGGIPKVIVDDDKRLLHEIYENIIYRDIIKRFNKNLEKPIKEASAYLLSNISKELGTRSMSNIIGIKNLATLKSILDAFEKAFLFFFVNKFDYSVRKQIQNPRKVYCIDNGFGTNIGFRFSEDKGRFLENLVFIELKRNDKEVYYYSDKGECDFVIKEGIKIKEAIQVCYELNDENREREINGLIGALDKFNLNEGLILTFNQDDELKVDGKKIKVLPVWKWILA